MAYAWAPWLFLSLVVFLWGLAPVRTVLEGGFTAQQIKDHDEKAIAAGLTPDPLTWFQKPNVLAGKTVLSYPFETVNNHVFRGPPVAQPPFKPEPAVFRLNWLTATGTSVLLAALLAAVWFRISPGRVVITFGRTIWMLSGSLFTMACMLALAYTTRFSGADVTLGLAFTHAGVAYPFFAPILGWLGVALTGSDTASNSLFGGLQKITAQRLGLDPLLIVTSNSTGGVMGKMIDAQSIVISASTTGQAGSESRILRFVFWHSLALACLMGLLVVLQAHALSWMVPK